MVHYRATITERPGKVNGVTRYGHDSEQNVLVIEFGGDKLYAYQGVDTVAFAAFVSTPSLTKHINAAIKPTYPCAHIGWDQVLAVPHREIPLAVAGAHAAVFHW